MRNYFYFFLLLLFVSCTETTKVNYPYELIDSKVESAGAFENSMYLYTIPEQVNIDTLKMFCTEKKKEFNSGAFHYIVFFDSKENASFPTNPITAFYGGDEKIMKHIKAYYEFNAVNGYSELHVFDKNSYESPSNTIKL